MKTMIRFTYGGNITIDSKLGKVLNLTMSSDETRCFINDVYIDIENNRLSTTNGRILFLYDFNDYEKGLLEGFKTGYYQVVKSKKETLLIPMDKEGQYPAINKLLAEDKKLYKNDDLYRFDSRENNNSKIIFNLIGALKMAINYKLVEKILKNFDSFKIYETTGENVNFVYLEGENWVLLVNGISVDS